jgi:uncharacterized protein YdiU (UPF0061 family)
LSDPFRFERRFLELTPGDASADLMSRQVHGAAWSAVTPTPVRAPSWIGWSAEVADLLGLPDLRDDPAALQILSGNAVAPGSQPWAACYGGHQFGNWAGQLGDGRAIVLGERVNPAGERYEVQLKGAGPTPYSRRADGRAVLRSSVREFLCSEAMFHLGIPTTRALSLVGTGEGVLRDILYDGHPADEPGAIVCRVAPSFLRFGTFELSSSRGDRALLEGLVRHTLAEHFPEVGAYGPDAIVQWFRIVGERTVDLAAAWGRVGFVHGVLNTDNLSIHGLTIDYGPYGWVEPYDPDWTPNLTDAGRGRYRFGWQPRVVLWNLARLAEALVPLVGAAAPFESALGDLVARTDAARRRAWSAKLGLSEARVDAPFIDELERVLALVETDMTLFFRALSAIPSDPSTDPSDSDGVLLAPWRAARYPDEAGPGVEAAQLRWTLDYVGRLAADGRPDAARRAAQDAVNPWFVLRNWLVQGAIERAAGGDVAGVAELLDAARRPYDAQPGREHLARKRPEWARNKPGCGALSCSS